MNNSNRNNSKNVDNILECRQLCKTYTQGVKDRLTILNGVDLTVSVGETVSIIGSSGSGKSTLLHILAGLDQPSSGEIILDGQSMRGLNDNQICSIRNTKLGFIYQFHHLLPEFTAIENVLMPLFIRKNQNNPHGQAQNAQDQNGQDPRDQENYARHILTRLGLASRVNHYPAQLSGGERQRVAIARAVINNPKLIFADEPTGNLDNQTGHSVLDILFELQAELKTSLIIVTHDLEVAAKTQTQYRLHNGILNPIVL
jgi:lipoprotein-releasing system ATP-binding protein